MIDFLSYRVPNYHHKQNIIIGSSVHNEKGARNKSNSSAIIKSTYAHTPSSANSL